jgi:nucleotide-binding universal stress UspA family protein
VLEGAPSHEEVERLRKQLHDEAERLRRRGVTVEEELAPDAPPEQILAARAHYSGAVLVVGAGRLGAARRVGRVAARLSQAARCPVLLVHSAAAFAAWSTDAAALKLAVGVDGSAAGEAAMAFAAALAARGRCEVIAARIYDPLVEHVRLGIPGVRSLLEAHPEIEKILARELSDTLPTLPDGTKPRIVTWANIGAPADPLARLAAREGADLLVVGAHQRGVLGRLWYGSTSRAVLEEAPMAVACVPSREAPAHAVTRLPSLQRVLAPTDLSEAGNAAIPYACAAAGEGGEVHLLYVVETSRDAPIKDREHLIERLLAQVPGEARDRGLSVTAEVIAYPEASKAIGQAAERLGADLICMSTRGQGLAKALFGSTAQAVSEDSRRAVMLIRPTASE